MYEGAAECIRSHSHQSRFAFEVAFAPILPNATRMRCLGARSAPKTLAGRQGLTPIGIVTGNAATSGGN